MFPIRMEVSGYWRCCSVGKHCYYDEDFTICWKKLHSDIENFTDREQYDRAADGLLADLRNTKPAPGFERVLYPGLRGAEIAAERRANGIPYHPEVQLPLGLAVVDLLRDALDCAVLEDR